MQVSRQIRHFIVENFLFGEDASMVEDHESLLDNGIIDSTGVLELLMYLEEGFQISVSDDELIPKHFDSISGMVSFLSSKVKSSEASG